MTQFYYAREAKLPSMSCPRCMDLEAAVNIGMCEACFTLENHYINALRLATRDKPRNARQPLTPAENDLLEHYATFYRLREVSQKMGLSKHAVEELLRRRGWSAAKLRLARSVRSLQQLIAFSGYDRDRLKAAAAVLKQHWRGSNSEGYLITYDQQLALFHYFQHTKQAAVPDLWSVVFAECLACGTNDREADDHRHYGHGLCFNCYHANRSARLRKRPGTALVLVFAVQEA